MSSTDTLQTIYVYKLQQTENQLFIYIYIYNNFYQNCHSNKLPIFSLNYITATAATKKEKVNREGLKRPMNKQFDQDLTELLQT